MITIRRARASDAEALARLRFAFRTELRPAVEAESTFRARCTAWMEARLVRESWLCWVADDDGDLVGHIWLSLIEKIPNPGPEDERHGYITNFYVSPAKRNQRVGNRLLDAALEFCRANGVDSVILWPTDQSRPLYQRHGFDTPKQVLLAVVGRSRTAPPEPGVKPRKSQRRHL